MNNYSFSIKKNYRWLMIICSLMNINFINASHEDPAMHSVEQESKRVEDDIRQKQQEQEDAQRKYDDEKRRIQDELLKEASDISEQYKDNNSELTVALKDCNDRYEKKIGDLKINFDGKNNELQNIINELQEKKVELASYQLDESKAQNEDYSIKKAQSDMHDKINAINVNYKTFDKMFKENRFQDDQYHAVIVTAAEFKRSLGDDFFVGRITVEQEKTANDLKIQSKVMIELAHSNIYMRLDKVINSTVINNRTTEESIKSVQDAINELYGLKIMPSDNPTEEEQLLIQEGKELLDRFNEQIKNTKTDLACRESILDIKKVLIEHLHGHYEKVHNLINELTDQDQLMMVQDMISELNDDLNNLDELLNIYQEEVDLGIEFITKSIQVILDEVDASLEKGLYDQQKNGQQAQYKVIEDLLYLNKAVDQLKSLEKKFEEKNAYLELLGKLLRIVFNKIVQLMMQYFINGHINFNFIFTTKDMSSKLKGFIHSVFVSITKRIIAFSKENNLPIMPPFFKHLEEPTIDEQIDYLNTFVNALKDNFDQYQKEFNVSLVRAKSIDVSTIPDFSNDKNNIEKWNDPKYEDFKNHYEEIKLLLQDCGVKLADAQRRNDMIINIIREINGIQFSINTTSYFLDIKSSIISFGFINDMKSYITKVKDFLIIPKSLSDDQLKLLGKGMMSLTGYQNVDLLTDDQKIDAGTLVFNSIKEKAEITDLTLYEITCLALMYADYYKKDLININAQIHSYMSSQVVNLLMTAGEIGWEELKVLMNGKKDYEQENQSDELTLQVKNIKVLQADFNMLPTKTAELINEMQDCVAKMQLWLDNVQNLIEGQENLQTNVADQLITAAVTTLEAQNENYDIFGIGIAQISQ